MRIPHWLQQAGKRDFKGILLVLGVFALALVVYSLDTSSGNHNPSVLLNHIGYHLNLVRSWPQYDSTLSRSREARRTRPFAPKNSESPFASSTHEIVLPYIEQQPSSYDQPQDGSTTAATDEPLTAAIQQASSGKGSHHKCEGRYVYIYPLPAEFNEDLVDKCGRATDVWAPLCGNLNNNGVGPQIQPHPLLFNESNIETVLELEPSHAWFRTEQFSLEVIFHERLKNGFPCLTQDPERASAFYIPYYAALDSAFTLFDPHMSMRDRLTQRLVGWLSGSEVWRKFQGVKKHFMVLGRISWDFSRSEEVLDGWGTSLLSQKELTNTTWLLIERKTWASNEIAIPYPTSFHPSSLQDMELWQESLRRRMRQRSKLLSSFIGSPSRGAEWSRALRARLAKQCQHAGANICQQYRCGNGEPGRHDCGRNPEQADALFASSTFCLQPSGDSPTRKGIFDSLLAGCIPVLFTRSSAYTQYMWHLPENGSLYSVLLNGDDVINGKLDVFAALADIAEDTQRLQSMQEAIINMLPHIVYALPSNHSSAFQDAVGVALERLFEGSSIPTF